MKNIVAYIIAAILVLALIATGAFFIFSKNNFLPWFQQSDQSFLDQPRLIDPVNEGDEINAIETDRPAGEDPVSEDEPEEEREPETVVATYFSGLQKPRLMAVDPFGNLIVSDFGSDEVYAIIDEDDDFRADRRQVIISGLNNPHGLAFLNNDLYIAETDKVRVLRGLNENYGYTSNDIIISDLTDNSGHFTRTIQIIDNKLYLSVGSSCNVCMETNENRAKILRYDLDGTNREVFAEGLRNTVGFVQSPFNGKIYGTDNGRDWLGDNLPPEEINIIEKGRHYGWPFCYGERVRDEDFPGSFDCSQTTPPTYTMRAHIAPLGLRFYNGEMFPEFVGDLFVAQHGSWNSSVPVGYKVIRIDLEDNVPQRQHDFLDIFITNNDTIKARPVDIQVGSHGEIFITDDFSGKIFVVYKQ